jgi:hypothetical protein
LQLAQLHDGKRVSVTPLHLISSWGNIDHTRLYAKVEVGVKTVGLDFFSVVKQKVGDVWL